MDQIPVSRPAQNEIFRGVRTFFLCFAAIFFIAAVSFAVWNLYRIMTFEKTEGTVASIGTEQTTGKTPATIYDIWVGFRAGRHEIYTRGGKSVFYKPYEKGDKAEIYYDPENPNNAFINTFGTIWFVPAILFLIGIIPLIIASRK
ncbi:MAG: DUF3592 domain-containing protein [Acidobacteria bacterium]|nr:DUF3592 domain-containing protein [Acidobacteriota bacterium]